MKTYNELPLAAREYIEFLEEETKIPVSWIGNGPEREAMIFKEPKKLK